MTITDLISNIKAHAPGSMIPRDWLLEQLSQATGEVVGVDSWVDRDRASEITGKSPRWLSARAVHWRAAPYAEIRVTKYDPAKKQSRWLFAEEDCWEYRRKMDKESDEKTGALEVEREQADPNDEESLLSHWAGRATANI